MRAPGMPWHFRHNAMFIGGNVREAIHEGRTDCTPIYLSEIGRAAAVFSCGDSSKRGERWQAKRAVRSQSMSRNAKDAGYALSPARPSA
jgi:hypothetical protein